MMRAGGWLPWRRYAGVWIPAVVFALLNVGAYFYLGGSTGGRAAGLRKDVSELEAECASLRRTEKLVRGEREKLQELKAGLEHINENVFGSLEKRLTRILREVERATKAAGLRPARFSYDAKEDKKSGLIRFGIRFSVEGRFGQIEKLLRELQSSEEFLIVDQVNLSGEKGTQSNRLKIAVHVSTYLVQADRDLLQRLVRRPGSSGKEGSRGSN